MMILYKLVVIIHIVYLSVAYYYLYKTIVILADCAKIIFTLKKNRTSFQ